MIQYSRDRSNPFTTEFFSNPQATKEPATYRERVHILPALVVVCSCLANICRIVMAQCRSLKLADMSKKSVFKTIQIQSFHSKVLFRGIKSSLQSTFIVDRSGTLLAQNVLRVHLAHTLCAT